MEDVGRLGIYQGWTAWARFPKMFTIFRWLVSGSLHGWDRWYINHPIGRENYHLYTTCIYIYIWMLPIGWLYATDPTYFPGTRFHSPLNFLPSFWIDFPYLQLGSAKTLHGAKGCMIPIETQTCPDWNSAGEVVKLWSFEVLEKHTFLVGGFNPFEIY